MHPAPSPVAPEECISFKKAIPGPAEEYSAREGTSAAGAKRHPVTINCNNIRASMSYTHETESKDVSEKLPETWGRLGRKQKHAFHSKPARNLLVTREVSREP